MARNLDHFLPIPGDTSSAVPRFVGDPGRWLPAARPVGPGRWHVELVGGPWTRTVELWLDEPRSHGRSWWRACSWQPVPGTGELVDRWLPTLDGDLGLVVTSASSATLMLAGRYEPPGGVVGDALDVVALGRVARRTVDRLLVDIAGHLASGTRADAVPR